MDNVQKTKSLKRPIIITLGSVFVVLVVLLVLDALHVISLSNLISFKNPFNTPFFHAKLQKAPTAVILVVGNENIYQKDLTTELAYFPAEENVDREKLLMDKLTRDSIILQAAQEEALIMLDNSVYNSPEKNYFKRIQLIAQVKDQIEKKKDRYKGSVVSIWFYNTKPGEVGYDKGKQIAFQKITQLQRSVAGKRMTMEEAAKQIENDAALAQLDPAYKANAYFRFDTDLKENIVFDKAFNATIKQLQKGEVSPVSVVSDKEYVNKVATGKLIESAYMFAYVEERTITGANLGFADWLERKLKKYEIVYR